MSIYMEEHIKLIYMLLGIDSIISLKNLQYIHSLLILHIIQVPLDVGEVARPVGVTHDILIWRINEK